MAGLLSRFRDPLAAQLSQAGRVHQLHDVEAQLYCAADPARPVGHLYESRWSNGIGSLTLDLENIPEGHNGTAMLSADGILLAGFDFTGSRLTFNWQGKLNGETLSFEPGQKICLEVGGLMVAGTVTAH